MLPVMSSLRIGARLRLAGPLPNRGLASSQAVGAGPCVAIAGVTGAVGQEFLSVLRRRNFPYSNLKLLASARSAGQEISFEGKTYVIEELTDDSFRDVDIALFSAGGSQSKRFAPSAVKSGCVVVDNSSAYRMDPDVPLVVPEVNPEAVKNHKVSYITMKRTYSIPIILE